MFWGHFSGSVCSICVNTLTDCNQGHTLCAVLHPFSGFHGNVSLYHSDCTLCFVVQTIITFSASSLLVDSQAEVSYFERKNDSSVYFEMFPFLVLTGAKLPRFLEFTGVSFGKKVLL